MARCEVGAVQEALLRQSLVRDGMAFDQVLWAILGDDWRSRGPVGFGLVH